MVFTGLYPVDADDYEGLKAALEKLKLNDASFSYEPEIERRAGLRLPLRLPRASCTRRSSRSASSASTPDPDHHGADRALPRRPGRTARSPRSRAPAALPDATEIERIEEP